MSAAKDLRSQLREDLAELSNLREEARLRLHLASMDAKTYFRELESKLSELERHALQDGRAVAADAATRLAADLKEAFHKFGKRLGA